MGYVKNSGIVSQLQYLKDMTPTQAMVETRRMRESAEQKLISFQSELRSEGLWPLYELGNLCNILKFFARKVKMFRLIHPETGEFLSKMARVQPEEATPKDYRWVNMELVDWQCLYEFDQDSNQIILIAAFYLGNTLIKNFPKLSWGLGKKGKTWRYPNHPSVLWPKKGRARFQLEPIGQVNGGFAMFVETGSFERMEIAIGHWIKFGNFTID